MKFKLLFWSGAAKEMVLHSALGGVKTHRGVQASGTRCVQTISGNPSTDMHFTIYSAQEYSVMTLLH